jgi:hypothetical protein
MSRRVPRAACSARRSRGLPVPLQRHRPGSVVRGSRVQPHARLTVSTSALAPRQGRADRGVSGRRNVRRSGVNRRHSGGSPTGDPCGQMAKPRSRVSGARLRARTREPELSVHPSRHIRSTAHGPRALTAAARPHSSPCRTRRGKRAAPAPPVRSRRAVLRAAIDRRCAPSSYWGHPRRCRRASWSATSCSAGRRRGAPAAQAPRLSSPRVGGKKRSSRHCHLACVYDG